jgi:prolyl-tRNA editing enzyme YbaK/EbsC (Cys-tRNA(Pro) deacylase)
MSVELVRAFMASAAPDVEIVELPASSQTQTLSAAWGIRPAQIAKTLALSVAGRAVLAVVCGDSRLDNKKVKAVLGGKATMLASEEAATITGHVLGGVCPFGSLRLCRSTVTCNCARSTRSCQGRGRRIRPCASPLTAWPR